ncbi:MAG: hypothetical protein Q4F84_09560, partial [Fibrobacter sp.]|nr:hypothetical protein [Fibrobacter sp.]
MVKKWFLMLLIGSMAAFSQEIALIGTVKDSKGTAIKDALVSLVNEAELNTLTDSKGVFKLEKVGVRSPYSISVKSSARAGVKGKLLQFTVASEAKNGIIEIFSANGRRNAMIPLGKLAAGAHTQELPSLTSGLYIMNITLDKSVTTFRLVNSGNGMSVCGLTNNVSGSTLRTAAVMPVDTLVVSKDGYAAKKTAIDSYLKNDIEIVLEADDEPVVCDLPDLPESSALPINEKLPDPFTFFDGTRMTKKSQWDCRRKEILAMASKYLYGTYPEKPDEVTGTVSGGTININCKVGSKTASFTATISGSGDLPICLIMSNSGISPSNKKTLSLGSGNESKIQNLYGISEINHLLADAWMVDRVMDVLELNPNSGHDPKKMMVTGCSGCGKGAFTVGLFSRIPLTVIVESGGGGVANMRMAHWMKSGAGSSRYKCGDKPQTMDALEDNGICGPWYGSAAQWVRRNVENVKKLPFDTHTLLASFAPRYVCSVTNQHGANEWCHLGGTAEIMSGWAAKPVYKALGIPERLGCLMYTENGAPMHCGNPASATNLANEFFKRVFQGDENAKTDVMAVNDSDLQQPQS